MKSQTPSGKYEDWVKADMQPKTFQITEDYSFAAGDEEVKLESKDPNVVALNEAKK